MEWLREIYVLVETAGELVVGVEAVLEAALPDARDVAIVER